MSATVIEQIESEIGRLAEYIRATKIFDESTTVNVHSLVCLMRYSAWKEPDAFKEWITSKKMERNPGVLDRIILMKSIDKSSEDGVEFRVHIFRDGNETFIHSHKQDFVTSCIQGYYIHRIWDVESDESQKIRVHVRTPKTGELTDLDVTNQRKLLGFTVESDEEGTFIRGCFRKPVRETKFEVGQKPMFVDRDWHHTVHDEDALTSVITIVARRGDRSKATTVLTDPEGGAKEPEVNTVDSDPSEEEKSLMYQELLNALLHRGHFQDASQEAKGTDLGKYMTRIEQLVRFDESVVDSPASMEGIRVFLKSNDFTMAPLVNDADRCVGILRRPVSLEGQSESITRRDPQTIGLSEHLFGAVLFNVVSRDLIVPVEDQDGSLAGLFSISDLVQDEDFSRALLYSIAREDLGDSSIGTARNFLDKLKELKGSFNGRMTKSEIDGLVHSLLLELGELIVMNKSYDFGRTSEPTIGGGEGWLEKSAHWPMYKFCVKSCESDEDIQLARHLLRELKKGSDIDQILIESESGDIRLMSTSSENLFDVETLPLESSFGDVVSSLRRSSLPIILCRDEEYGIVSPFELQNPPALMEIANFILQDSGEINVEFIELLKSHILQARSGGTSPLTFEQAHGLLR